MIAILLLAAQVAPAALPTQAPAPAAAPLGEIGRQVLPVRGCAAFLWSADRRMVAMAVADPARIRLAIDGRVADYPRTAQSGAGAMGFAQVGEYRGGDVVATLDMTIAPKPDMTGGAPVPSATLRIDRAGGDTLVLPLAGLVGCA